MQNHGGIDIYGKARAYVYKPIKAVAITAGTPAPVWTPAAGKRFRLLGFCVNPTVAASILFEDATGGTNEFLRFSLTAAGGTPQMPVNFGQYGDLSTTAKHPPFPGVTGTANGSGHRYRTEEE